MSMSTVPRRVCPSYRFLRLGETLVAKNLGNTSSELGISMNVYPVRIKYSRVHFDLFRKSNVEIVHVKIFFPDIIFAWIGPLCKYCCLRLQRKASVYSAAP